MEAVENQAWDEVCAMTPHQVMKFYRESGETRDFHRQIYAKYRDLGEFSCVNEMVFFYADAAELHEAAIVSTQNH